VISFIQDSKLGRFPGCRVNPDKTGIPFSSKEKITPYWFSRGKLKPVKVGSDKALKRFTSFNTTTAEVSVALIISVISQANPEICPNHIPGIKSSPVYA